MKTPLLSPRGVMAAALALGACLLPATAHARGRSTTVYGARGGVYHRDVSHTPGHFAASQSATLPNGRTASRSVQSSVTATGRTTQAQATGFGGRAASYSSTRVADPSGFTRQATVTGPKGGTATKTVDVTRESGTTTRTVVKTRTSPNP